MDVPWSKLIDEITKNVPSGSYIQSFTTGGIPIFARIEKQPSEFAYFDFAPVTGTDNSLVFKYPIPHTGSGGYVTPAGYTLAGWATGDIPIYKPIGDSMDYKFSDIGIPSPEPNLQKIIEQINRSPPVTGGIVPAIGGTGGLNTTQLLMVVGVAFAGLQLLKR